MPKLYDDPVCSVIESELCDPQRGRARDHLERLDDSGDDLVLEAGILPFGVLTHDYDVDIIIARLQPREASTRPNASVKLKSFAQRQIERHVAGPNWRGQRAFKRNGVLANGGERLVGNQLASGFNRFGADGLLFPCNRRLGSVKDSHNSVGDLRTDAVAWKLT